MVNQNEFRDQLVQEDLFQTSVENYVESLRSKKNIVIWGSSLTGDWVYDFLDKFCISDNIKNFADNKKEKWGTSRKGLIILSPMEVVRKVKEEPDTYIIVAAMHLGDIVKQLLSLGVDQKVIDVKGFGLSKMYWTNVGDTPHNIIYSNIKKYEEVYHSLSDERSRSILLGILNFKISLDSKYLKGIASPAFHQYFDPEVVHLKEDEIFCDCGSFNGDTLEVFMETTGRKYKKYFAIEADRNNYYELKNKVETNGYEHIQIYNLACWNEQTILNFEPGLMAGQIVESGGTFVEADKLDHILENEPVSFLKMDIEGAEEMALTGAQELIKKYKPKLAICLYHSTEDYFKLPLIIKKLDPEYQLFIRHYRDMVDTETVCYAIPR